MILLGIIVILTNDHDVHFARYPCFTKNYTVHSNTKFMYNINVKIFVDISIKTNITHALQSKCIKCIKMYKLNFNSFRFLPCNNNQCKYLFNLAFLFLPPIHAHTCTEVPSHDRLC